MRRKGSELTSFEWHMLKDYFSRQNTSFKDIAYSYRVGEGIKTNKIDLEWLRRCMRDSTQLKIDCVAVDSNDVHMLIEVKKRAGPGSVGQALVYSHLYHTKNNCLCQAVILCKSIHPDILEVAQYFGVQVVII